MESGQGPWLPGRAMASSVDCLFQNDGQISTVRRAAPTDAPVACLHFCRGNGNRNDRDWSRVANSAGTRRGENARRRSVRRRAGRGARAPSLGPSRRGPRTGLHAAGVRGGENSGSSSVEIIDKAFSCLHPQGIVNLIVTTVVLLPYMKKLFFEAICCRRWTKFMPTTAAVGASAVIFALIHEHGIGDTQVIAVGFGATGIVYARTRNLGAPIVSVSRCTLNAGLSSPLLRALGELTTRTEQNYLTVRIVIFKFIYANPPRAADANPLRESTTRR